LKILEWKDDAGRTALSWAAEEGKLEVVRALLDWGADPLSCDKGKQTLRMFALDKGHTKVAKILASDHVSSKAVPGNALLPTVQLSPLTTSHSPLVDSFIICLKHHQPIPASLRTV
jgi:ankyrin repeat protein